MVQSQAKVANESQLKAAFLYNFTRFITWPETAFENGSSPFIIGIVGDEVLGAFLSGLVKGEKINDREIVVRNYSRVDHLQHCQMVFLGVKDAAKARELIAGTANMNVLTVSDVPKFADEGGVIGFFKQDSKVKIHINTTAAKAARVEISSKLLKLAKISQ